MITVQNLNIVLVRMKFVLNFFKMPFNFPFELEFKLCLSYLIIPSFFLLSNLFESSLKIKNLQKIQPTLIPETKEPELK